MRWFYFLVQFSHHFANISSKVTLIRDQVFINVGAYEPESIK